MTDHLYALTQMKFQDGLWTPVEGAGIFLGSTISAAMDSVQTEDSSVYGAWYVSGGEGETAESEEKISTTRPDFMVTQHPQRCRFVLKAGHWILESPPEPRLFFAVTGLRYQEGVYVVDLDTWGIHVGPNPVKTIENCHGGNPVTGTSFGVWPLTGTNDAREVIKERIPDALYLVDGEGSLQALPRETIEQLVRAAP